jgi:hypothetical protein
MKFKMLLKEEWDYNRRQAAEEVLKYLDRRFIDRLRTASNREAEMRMVSDLLGGEPLTEKNIKISMNELRFLIREVIKNKLKL